MTDTRPLRVAVIGAGRMGMIHGHLLSVFPETEVVGFVDRDTGLRDHLASQGLSAPLYPNVEALFAAATPEAVFICTPTHTHLTVVRECLGRRVHLFIEKPLATTLADAEAILHLATEARVVHAAGYVYAHLPIVQAAHDLLARGVLGETLHFTAHAYVSEVFGPKRLVLSEGALGRRGGGEHGLASPVHPRVVLRPCPPGRGDHALSGDGDG